MDNEAERALIPFEGIEEQLELVEVLLFKHVDASSVFRADSFSHLGDELMLDKLKHLCLGLRLKPIVSICLFIQQELLNFVKVFGTVPVGVP